MLPSLSNEWLLRIAVELYVRWMQGSAGLSPRRASTVAGFYRTAVIDGLMSTRRPSTSGGRTCQT